MKTVSVRRIRRCPVCGKIQDLYSPPEKNEVFTKKISAEEVGKKKSKAKKRKEEEIENG